MDDAARGAHPRAVGLHAALRPPHGRWSRGHTSRALLCISSRLRLLTAAASVHQVHRLRRQRQWQRLAARHRRAPAWQPAVDGAGEHYQCQEVINQPSSTAHVSRICLEGHVSATMDSHVGLKTEMKWYGLEMHHLKSLWTQKTTFTVDGPK